MRASEFTAQAPGRLVKIRRGSQSDLAYVPDPLPPATLRLGADTRGKLRHAERALGELAGVATRLQHSQPHLIRSFLRREAAFSTLSRSAPEEIQQALFEPSPSYKPRANGRLEVGDYLTALDYGLARVKTHPVDVQLMGELHKRLTRSEVGGRARPPGGLRDFQMHMGEPGKPTATARFVAPPADEMRRGLGELERFIAGQDDLPFLVKLALIHYQFETLHPFSNANGRLGRSLLTLLLCQQGLLSEPLLYLSVYLYRNRGPYVDLMLQVSKTGAWGDWIDLFVEGVAEQSLDGVRRAQRLLELGQRYRQAVNGSRCALQLVDWLFAYPAITVEDARTRLGVTRRKAELTINELRAAGILAELGQLAYSQWLRTPRRVNERRNAGYAALEILGILQLERA